MLLKPPSTGQSHFQWVYQGLGSSQGPSRYARINPTKINHKDDNSTGPRATASLSAVSNPLAIASIPNNARARVLDRCASASRSPSGIPTISHSASAQICGSGAHSHPVLSSGGSSTMLSVGPPLLHARTGRPHSMPSMGPMPKCSLAGVYRKASVDGAERRAERCAVVKLRRNRT